MESIKNADIKNKIIILRCDFNVTIKENKIIDDTKIISSLKTIELLLKNNNKLIRKFIKKKTINLYSL